MTIGSKPKAGLTELPLRITKDEEYSRAKMLWDLLLAIADSNWVFPLTVRQFLFAWQSANVGRKRKRVWMAAPLYLFWTLWKERNRAAFENEAPSTHRMKSTFFVYLVVVG